MHIQSHNKNFHAYTHVANDHIWMYMKVVKDKVLFWNLSCFLWKKAKKKVFKFICCNVLADTSYYKHLTLKTNKSSYLMFIVFLSNPLHLDIYACLH